MPPPLTLGGLLLMLAIGACIAMYDLAKHHEGR